MITLQKIGDAIKFTFSGNTHYLQDGTVEVPVNSLSLTIDDSGMATFRKSASNDIFISATYGELGMTKEELVAWYKENMVDGGGPDITSGDVQSMIDESISGKQDTLIAGENISISGNVISAAGGNNAIELTQAEYDALVSAGTVDQTAFYIITDATEIDISNYYTTAQTQSAITSAINGLATVATSGSYNDLSNKPTIPTVTNQITSGSTDVVTSGGVYDQLGGMKIVKLTESEYTALVTKNSDTLYVVVPDPSN